ncbi:MAG: hypothetical protein RLZZ546_51 [Bacteroidota bacterium]
MQFKVPQFLDIEDKIFGPFTFSQFAYLAGGAGICFFLYKFFGFLIGAIPIILVASLALALTFWRPNSKPFSDMIEAFLIYISQSRLYIWQRKKIKKEAYKQEEKEKPVIHNPKLSNSKLRDLAWSLDVLDLKK